MLLATRNVVKTTKHNKSVRLGIGKKDKYEYVTTISLPRQMDDAEPGSEGAIQPGGTRIPHLRRAHVRRQHHGPRNQLVKMKLIPSVFVNADKEWVGTRTAYNVNVVSL